MKKLILILFLIGLLFTFGCSTTGKAVDKGPKITFSGDISESGSCKGTAVGNLITYNKCDTTQKCESGCVEYCQGRGWVYQNHDINRIQSGKDIFGNPTYGYKCSCTCIDN